MRILFSKSLLYGDFVLATYALGDACDDAR